VSVIINPGAGTLARQGRERDARRSLAMLLRETGLEPTPRVRFLGADDTNRYTFRLTWGGRETTVDMPALSRRKLQPAPGYTPPRLYVDGSSWWWPYAVDMVRSELAPGVRS
jgi:hypothetical protein